MNKQTDLTSELCELNYEKNKQLLEDLLLTTIWGMFIIFLLIKLLFNCNIIECIKYTFMLIGAPYSIRYFLGEFEISFSIFGILIFIIEAVFFLFLIRPQIILMQFGNYILTVLRLNRYLRNLVLTFY